MTQRTHWVIEYRVNPSGRRSYWYMDLRTIRENRYAARQAPLDIDQTPQFYDQYNQRWRDDTVRVVKVRVTKVDHP